MKTTAFQSIFIALIFITIPCLCFGQTGNHDSAQMAADIDFCNF